ncbi:MAG: anthranilate synthase component II [Acidimicrobiales bacterium]
MGARVAVIDNYDSFVYNLVQYLGELGADPLVLRNDEIDLAGLRELAPEALVVSPGPGRPESAGISKKAIRAFADDHVPVLGVCLGHQCIGELYGGEIVRADELVHGKASPIEHDGKGLFRGLPNPFQASRYHSLVVSPLSVPADLEVTARTPDGLIMGLRHRYLLVEGLQFHPESILTGEAGKQLLANFLSLVTAAAS